MTPEEIVNSFQITVNIFKDVKCIVDLGESKQVLIDAISKYGEECYQKGLKHQKPSFDPEKPYTEVIWSDPLFKKYFPSLNEQNTTNYHVKTKLKKDLSLHILDHFKQKYKKKVLVVYDRISVHLMDRDNFGASTKYFLDCLKKAKIIVDDDNNWIHLEQIQDKAKHYVQEQIKIIIQEIDD